MLVRIMMFLLVGMVLTGCASKPMEVAQLTSIKTGLGSQGIDVYAKRRKAGEKVPEFTGDQILPIRSYMVSTNGFGGLGKEISGAKCSVKARNFSAKVVTPAKIRVPIYRSMSSPLSVSCTKSGFLTKTAEFGVYNKTKSGRLNAGASAGVVGLLAMAAVNGLSDAKTHEFLYTTPQIAMTPVK